MALLTVAAIDLFSWPVGFAIAGSCVVGLLLLLRLDELTMSVIVGVHIYVDWYLGLHLFGPLMAIIALIFFFLTRAPRYPWTPLPAFWLWATFLLLTLYPAIRGATMLFDLASFYPSNMLGACLMFWLGVIVARNETSLRRLMQCLMVVGMLLAIHTLIQSLTGVVLFGTSHYDALLTLTSDYQLGLSNTHRVGSFFVDPNWNGTFLAMMFFVPLGLFFEAQTIAKKALYLVPTVVLLSGVVATYSNGAWAGLGAGTLAFILLVGRLRRRLALLFFVGILVAALLLLFPTQIALQLQHAAGNDELPLRIAGWETGWNVMLAYPLMGVGFGYTTYMNMANPFRVPGQVIPLAHPHNSYVEWGAMGGIPVLVVFLLLLGFAFWRAWCNWYRANSHSRALLGGGMAAIVALSVNSFSINGWTLPAISMVGWLILGAVASPLAKEGR